MWAFGESRRRCTHLGQPTGELVQCQTCPGRLKVFECAVHGRCTLGRSGEGVPARCLGCHDRLEAVEDGD